MKTALLAVFIFYSLTSNAANYYFSANSGNDTYSNLQAQSPLTPWQTLTKFNSVFASLQPGDSVLFKRGETFYGSLTISRSGTNVLPIVIGAYGTGAKPIITGMTKVSAWTSLGGGIYESTSAVTSNTTLNMVTFQDTIQAMGRWPKLNSANGGYLLHQSHSGIVSITSNQISTAASFVGGEVVIRKYQWILDRGRVTAQTSTTVTLIPFESPDHPGFTYEPIDGHGFFFQNHVNACTRLGEWAYDSTARKIKMYFGGASPASYTIKVTDLDVLVGISSKSYVRFDNLQFIGSNSKTFNISSCNNIQINSCDIKFSGINAIRDNGGSNTIKVYNCTISYTNNNAIYADGSTLWTIQNNIIRNTGMIRGAGESGDGQYNAIFSVRDKSLIEYNQIINTGYLGVHFKKDSVVIKNNFIDSFCMTKSDGGGIYTYADQTNTGRRIVGNIVINGIGDRYGIDPEALTNPYAGNVHGIYMDGGSENVEISGNTTANCDFSGLHLGSSQNMVIENNTFYNNRTTQINAIDVNQSLSNLIIKHNILFSKQADQLIVEFAIASDYLTTIGTIDSNYYCRPIFEPQNIDVTGYSHGDWSFPYNDGGIIHTAFSPQRFRSLNIWKTFSGKDAHTKNTSFLLVLDANSIRFEYNATNVNKTFILDGNYVDVKNSLFENSVTLEPYSSIVLMKIDLIVLPLQFYNLEVYKTGSEASLEWTRTDDVNTLFFEIERSADGIHFSRINTIHGNNIPGNKSVYSDKDIHPLDGNNFYRLKQVNSNGDFSYSKTVKIFFERQVAFQISPNPVHNQLRIDIDKVQNSQNGFLLIQTLSGNIVKAIPVNSTSNVFIIDISNLPNAPYFVNLIYKDFIISKKIVKCAQ